MDQLPAMPTPTSAGASSSLLSAGPFFHRAHGISSYPMLPPTSYTSRRSTTPPTALATLTYAAGTSWPKLNSQPTTVDAGLPSDAEMSSPAGTPDSVSATLLCTETPVAAASTVANGIAPQSSNGSMPAHKSASIKEHGEGSMEEAASWSDKGELSEGPMVCAASRRLHRKGGKRPSPGHRTHAKAGGDAASLLCERTDVTRVGGSVKQPVSSTCAHFDIPSPNPVALGVMQKVVVSFYSTPSDFWLQFPSSGEVLQTDKLPS